MFEKSLVLRGYRQEFPKEEIRNETLEDFIISLIKVSCNDESYFVTDLSLEENKTKIKFYFQRISAYTSKTYESFRNLKKILYENFDASSLKLEEMGVELVIGKILDLKKVYDAF